MKIIWRKEESPYNKQIASEAYERWLEHLISVANVLHAENPLAVEDDWIEEYNLAKGNVDVTAVDSELVTTIPSATQMGKVYQRLIYDTMQPGESEVEGIIRIYNDEICDVIDNYV